MASAWNSKHWSLANAVDTDVTDLPLLLRRVADQIEADGITAMELLDVVVSQEMTDIGPHWSVTVYWSPDHPEVPDTP